MHRLSRLPLRVRLTLSFAGAAAVLLAVACGLIFLDVRSGLDGSLDSGLRRRATYLEGLAAAGDETRLRRALETDIEPAQLIEGADRVVAASASAGRVSLMPDARYDAASEREVTFELNEEARLLARPVAGGRVLVVATSMKQRERALNLLGAGLLIGGPLILLLASGAGYLVATGALRPVERMRRRAAEISTATSDARLPLPDAHDELHRLGETLNAMLARLEAAAAGERAFLASASHELRTPLAILKAEVELALGGDEASLTAALQSVGEEADRLVRLAEDLLVVARGQEGRLPLNVEDVDLAALCDDLVAGYAALGETSVRHEIAPGTTVRADPARLQQALANLIDNALRHGSPPVTVTARTAGETLEVHVLDRGGGFPEDALGLPMDGTPRTNARGFGLGLAIVASIARAHGGQAVTANTADGADAWLSLPAD